MKDAKAVVVAEYRGLTVRKTEDLRRLLRKEGCELIVAKNNIARRAAQACGFGALENDLKGPSGLIISRNDAIVGAKVLNDFVREERQARHQIGCCRRRLLQSRANPSDRHVAVRSRCCSPCWPASSTAPLVRTRSRSR
ncbi:MAG: 50S ribosomal protein L10 [Bacillus subtilis]|nr:50S ribosomal protein L10 [Bacillus subtilis]